MQTKSHVSSKIVLPLKTWVAKLFVVNALKLKGNLSRFLTDVFSKGLQNKFKKQLTTEDTGFFL